MPTDFQPTPCRREMSALRNGRCRTLVRLQRFLPVSALLLIGFLPWQDLAAQTVIAIGNPGFESPPPTVFPDYTIGATGWTRTRNDIDAGTFAPGLATPPVTPAPIDGVQVGYANGSGGLQQVLTTGFVAGYSYSFSVYIGFRSDETNAAVGHGAIQLGYLDGAQAFVSLASQSASPGLGQFNFVTGSYQATLADQGQSIVIRLVDTASVQVLFDHVQLTATAIPEPAAVAAVFGAVALVFAARRVRSRTGELSGGKIT